MTAQADNPAATASRRRAASAPAAKPPSSQGLAEFTSALHGWLRCGCSSAVAAPIAMPMHGGGRDRPGGIGQQRANVTDPAKHGAESTLPSASARGHWIHG